MSLLIGVDLGTSETKAGLFDLYGNLLRLARCGYPIEGERSTGAAEQNPETWLASVCQTVREVAEDVAREELVAICIEGQGPSVVLCDERGQPLRNAVLWMDTRTADASARLSEQLGRRVSPFAHLPLAMWLGEYSGEALDGGRWFMAAWDYVAFRLTGKAVASAIAYFEPFPADEVEASGLPERFFPPVVPAGSRIAGLSESGATETGLPQGLPVVAGTHDGIGTFLGAGLVEPGRAADVNGTSGGLALCWNGKVSKPGIFAESWINPGEYIVGGAMATLGKCLDWARHTLMPADMSRSQFAEEAARAPAGSDGLIFLPYLAGERAPIWDPKAMGVFCGLGLRHERKHIARAVLESVGFALRHVADEVVAAGARIDEVKVCGGQARSDIWNQIKADVLGIPVAVPRVREAALMGAAILAGVGGGALPDIVAGSNTMARTERVLAPDLGRHAVYSDLYEVYRRLYPDLKEAFHRLAEISRGEG
jgi:xylulokinase